MHKLPLPPRIIILAVAGVCALLAAIIAFAAAVRSSLKPIPASLESEYIEETLPPHPLKSRMPVPPCRYDLSLLQCEEQVFRYSEDGVVTSRFGIDVSSHQPGIDWEAVRAAGVEFVFVRAGFRGYETGKLVQDECFDQNMQGALDAGLDVGVYFYSQAVTPAEALEEAELTLSMMEGYDITYPVVFDWEIITHADYARTSNVSMSNLTDCTIAFCEAIRNAGYEPMFYQNKETALTKLDLELLTDYGFWLAEYEALPSYPHHFDIWQYTAKGTVPGIEGTVDLNICFTDYGKEEDA